MNRLNTSERGFIEFIAIGGFVLLIAFFVVIYLFFVEPVQIQGRAMDPNYKDGEYYLVNKLSKGDFKRGEVVVFEPPIGENSLYVKRIVGVPKDKISISTGKLLVDGQPLEEPYLSKGTITHEGAFLHEGQEVHLKDDEYLLFGDNREASSDSRSWGPIKKEDIVGKLWFKYGGK